MIIVIIYYVFTSVEACLKKQLRFKLKVQRESNYIYPESTWRVRLISATCVAALVGGVVALINYSHAVHAPQAEDGEEPIVEVAFFASEAPMPLGEQLEAINSSEEAGDEIEPEEAAEPEEVIEPEPEPETEPEEVVEPELEPQPEPEPKPEVEPEALVEPKPESKPEPKPKPIVKPKPEPKQKAKPQPRPQSKPQVKQQPLATPKPQQLRSLTGSNQAFGTPMGQAKAAPAAPAVGASNQPVNVSALNFLRQPNLRVDTRHGYARGQTVAVRVRVTVDERGKLMDVAILSGGNARLNRDLLRQLRQQLSFKPHMVNGVARKARGDFTINIQVR